MDPLTSGAPQWQPGAGQRPLTPLEKQLMMLRNMASQQAGQQIASQQAAVQASQAPYRNKGQGVLDSILRPDRNQARAMIEAGAGFMGAGGRPNEAPGVRLARGAANGLDLLSRMRSGPHAAQAQAAAQNVDSLSKLHTMYGQAGGPGTEWARGETNQYIDSEGNRFFGTSMTSKDGRGKMVWTPLDTGGPAEPIGAYEQVGPKGLTSEGRIAEDAESRRRAALATSSAQNAQQALESFQQARSSLVAMDNALQALADGANTGPITSLFPSFREATIALENAQKTMGLDVVGATTFGALSKGELDLALAKALPLNMEEDDLIKWLADKREATVKLMRELQKAANHFQNDMLPGDYISMLEEQGLFERSDPGYVQKAQEIIRRIREM